MRHETYRFALDEATAELKDIVSQFEALKSRKEQIEQVVEALRPFIGLQTSETTTPAAVVETTVATSVLPETEQSSPEPEPEYTFMQISGPGMEVKSSQPEPAEVEQVPEPVAVHTMDEATPEQIAYFRQPSADPFQRRIDDALWGWQQRPEGLLSPI
jgi:hypothetical protein